MVGLCLAGLSACGSSSGAKSAPASPRNGPSSSAAGSRHWSKLTTLPRGSKVEAVACLSATTCLASTNLGLLSWTTDANSSAPHWTTASTFSNSPHAFACPSPSLCIAGDDNGDILYTTQPLQSLASWSSTKVDAGSDASTTFGNAILSVSCGSSTFCVAVDADGNSYMSTDPVGGAWSQMGSVAPSDPDDNVSVSCAGTTCLAVNGAGYGFLRGGTWSGVPTNPPFTPTKAACLSATQCLLFGSGDAETITPSDPTTGVLRQVGVGALSVSCPTASFCVTADSNAGGGDVGVSRDPTGPASAWQDTNTFPGAGLVACSPQLTCVLGTDDRVATASY